MSIEKPAISTLTIKGRFESVTAARQASILKARVRPPLEAPTNKGPPVAKQLKPCEVELGRCCFIDHWAGCWEKGHEPHDRDERKCPTSAAAVDGAAKYDGYDLADAIAAYNDN